MFKHFLAFTKINTLFIHYLLKMRIKVLDVLKINLINHVQNSPYYAEEKLHKQIIYYNNLILAIVIFFIIFSVLILLEDNDPYYNISTITFLLLLTFNLIILFLSHNLSKQFFHPLMEVLTFDFLS